MSYRKIDILVRILTVVITGVACIAMISASCIKLGRSSEIPQCIQKRINRLKDEPCPSVKEVHRYIFKGKKVYVFTPRDCGADLTTDIFDSECVQKCSLGGFTGNRECEGEQFYNNAIEKTLVWPMDK